MSTVHEFSCDTISGEKRSLSEFKGKVMLIVNTASKCGFTPQFKDLEQMYADYQDKGLEILGFPCNQFGKQDPGSNETIEEFCQLNYGVSFNMFAKVDVNGNEADPLFGHLKEQAPGIMGSKNIKWNFTKFLVDQNGVVVKRYAPATKPSKIIADINALLA